ncbi:phenylacetate--CoA ligase family protein [Calditrichota bacterium]
MMYRVGLALYRVMQDYNLTLSKLEPVVSKRLRNTLVSAYRYVPHYRAVMKSIDYNPEFDYNGPDDLKIFPILTKEDIKSKNPSEFLNKNFDMTALISAHTSGSTGTPMIVYREPAARAIQIACWLRVMFHNGYKPRDKTLLVSIFSQTKAKTNVLQKLGLFRRSVVRMLDSYDELVDYIQLHRFDVIYGNRSSFSMFAQEFEKRNTQADFIKLLLAGGEIINDHFRNRCETYLGVRPTEYYGTVETGTLAYETPARDGLHLFEDQIYFEFLDQEGKPSKVGTPARLVVTRLNGDAMPFIRYDVGDLVTVGKINDTDGEPRRILTSIIGRDNELIKLPDGSTTMYQEFAADLNRYTGLRQYRVIQEKSDYFRIYLAGEGNYVEQMIRDLTPKFDELLHPHSKYKFEAVDEIPLDKSGKFRTFISLIN